ncbi:branched-chain amino acid transport system ATP-binding protein [Agromyces terreus]|uniref:Branched-chain amino acid transport system ATP-binding protein n=1 Tax=Agromyces terreus TaxID=424795 RepID=A0A9X2GXK8_9MICO|nr:ABC transporter ATP-binding protein [Agromyces terreus]MCP2370935.1 branched-chain amino acid transport system ATP-binding protein [Agromyces terreus]
MNHTPSDAEQTSTAASAAPSVPEPRLRVDGLTVRFGGLTALDDVSFEVGRGEVVALIGPNGAGKTTVFNAISGLVRRAAGDMRIDGAPAPARPTGLVGRRVARTLQGLGLFDSMSVLENVLVPLEARSGAGGRGRRGDAAEQASGCLGRLGIAHLAAVPVAALPYPERKRVALARALVTDPDLLLLDEPAGGLGEEDIDTLAEVVREVAASGCSVLLVEHHVDFVMGVADRIVVLDFGRVIACGTPDEVRADPRVEEAYLGIEPAA